MMTTSKPYPVTSAVTNFAVSLKPTTRLAKPYHYRRNGIYYLRLRKTGSTTQATSVFAAELEAKPYHSRLSGLFFETLMECDGRTFKAVIAEIDYLERMPGSEVTRTKPAKRLHGEILGGLRHAHYSSSEHLIENIRLHWEAEANQVEVSRIKEAMAQAAKDNLSPDEMWKFAGDIAGTLVGAHGVRKAKRKLTGEWIVYATWDDEKNYYMDLSVHGELADEQALYDRLYAGCPEFDFCFEKTQPVQ